MKCHSRDDLKKNSISDSPRGWEGQDQRAGGQVSLHGSSVALGQLPSCCERT